MTYCKQIPPKSIFSADAIARHKLAAADRRVSRHLESTLQRNCVAWFRLQYRAHASLLFAVPNGGGRSPVEAAIMRGEGVLAGVSDLILLESRGGYGSLCIEMKTQTGRQSTAQKKWQKAAEAAGNRYVVCRTFDDFKATVEAYMRLSPTESNQTPAPAATKKI